MEKLIEILENIKPGVDFRKEKRLVNDEIIDSFDIVTIISQINDEFDIDFPVTEIMPENFDSAEALYKIITELQSK